MFECRCSEKGIPFCNESEVNEKIERGAAEGGVAEEYQVYRGQIDTKNGRRLFVALFQDGRFLNVTTTIPSAIIIDDTVEGGCRLLGEDPICVKPDGLLFLGALSKRLADIEDELLSEKK